MGSKEEEVIELLRACLLSAKGGIPLTKVSSDYRSLAGEPLPFRQLGFSSLRDFLRSVPGLRIVSYGNEEMLEAIPTKNTEHLAAMVAKQKSAPSRRARPHSVAPRRIAKTSWNPPRITSRSRSTGLNMHEPLHITLNNDFNSGTGTSYEKPTRLVSYASGLRSVNSWSSQPTSQLRLSPTGGINSSSSSSSVASDDGISGSRRLKSVVVKVNNSKEPRNEITNGDKYNDDTKPVPYTKYKYEVPPRLQKLSAMTSAKKPVTLHHIEQPTIDRTLPAEIPPPEMPPPEKPVLRSAKQQAQSRLQAISLSKLDLSKTVNYEPTISTFERTITSPLTPLQARLTAVVKKQQPTTMDKLAEQFKEATITKNDGSIVSQLEKFAKEKGLSKPEYKVNSRKMKEGPLVTYSFISCVKVEEFSFSGYPDEAPTPELAKEIAAKRALSELTTMYSGVGGKGSVDPNTVMSRVTEVALRHPSGIWSTSIPAEYLEEYHENLPDDWLEIIKRCPLLSLEHISDKRIIVVPNLGTPEDSEIPVSPPLSTVESLHNKKGQSVLHSLGAVVPEPLKFPQEDVWDIFVTFATTTTEVWARLLGDDYSGLYDNISLEMELHYAGQSTPVTNPEVGLFYTVKLDDCWYRCEVLEIEDKVAKVFFIDHGDEEVVPVEDLHVLERRFGSLPAQAIKFSLRGLESFASDPNVSRHVGEIIGKTLIAQVHERPSKSSDAVSVTIYDTSTADDINMNTVLMEAIGNDVLAPQLPPENHVKEVYVSHVTPTGDVYVRLETLLYLESMLQNFLENNVDIANTANVGTPDTSQIYLAPYSLDLNLYRASVSKILDNNRVEVFFVDYGNSEVVNVSSLIPLYTLKKSLAQFPHQVLKVRLHNVPSSVFSQQMADRLRELVPLDLPVLLKVIHSKGPDGVPVVELFKRIQPDNILASINNTLALDPDLTLGTSTDTVRSNAEQRSPRSTNCDIYAVLPAPKIPPIGEYFDVHVTMAANPGNFTVQPYKDCELFKKMMYEMQEEYSSDSYPPLEPSAIREQGLYAALHLDGNWYRVCVQAVIKHMVSVYLCDYGELSVLTPDRLRTLNSRFRELPYQGIKAKLADVKPCHADWSVDDCLAFQDMVVDRAFVSIIRDASPDATNVGTAVIGLTLINVSGEKDEYIHEQLIKQGRAVLVSNKA